MKTVKVAILGLGTVGSGVYKLIQKRADVMEKTIGAQMEVKKILVRNINKKREGVDASLLTDNWNDIIEDDEIQIVIEVMGGIEPAKTMILEALRDGMFCSGEDFDLTFGLMHTVEKSAEILVKILSMTPRKIQTITPENFRELAHDFNVTLPEEFLYEKKK